MTLILEALAKRGGDKLRDAVIERLNIISGPWARYFALRAIDAMTPSGEPILGRVIATVDTSWVEPYGERLSPQMIEEFAERRLQRNDPATFLGALKDRSAYQLDTIKAVLDLLENAAAKPAARRTGNVANEPYRHSLALIVRRGVDIGETSCIFASANSGTCAGYSKD